MSSEHRNQQDLASIRDPVKRVVAGVRQFRRRPEAFVADHAAVRALARGMAAVLAREEERAIRGQMSLDDALRTEDPPSLSKPARRDVMFVSRTVLPAIKRSSAYSREQAEEKAREFHRWTCGASRSTIDPYRLGRKLWAGIAKTYGRMSLGGGSQPVVATGPVEMTAKEIETRYGVPGGTLDGWTKRVAGKDGKERKALQPLRKNAAGERVFAVEDLQPFLEGWKSRRAARERNRERKAARNERNPTKPN